MSAKDHAEKRIAGLVGVILVLMAGISIAALRNISRSRSSSDWVNHTEAVISEAEEVGSSVNAAERALRDFVLTGAERDRAGSREHYAQALEHLSTGKGLTRAEPAQNAEFSQLEGLLEKRVNFAKTLVKARLEGGLEAARKVIEADPDETAEIQRDVGKLRAGEENLLRERDHESYLQAQNTRWIVFVGVALNAAILIFMVCLARDDIKARRRANQALEEANRDLDARVRERTAELAAANRDIESQILEQRWSNQALNHQLRYNQQIINSIDTLVLVVSKASNITRINPAVTRQTGFESSELVGRPLAELLTFEDSPPARGDPVMSSMKDGRDLTDSSGVLRGKNGQKTNVKFSVYPVRDSDKIVGGVMTIKMG